MSTERQCAATMRPNLPMEGMPKKRRLLRIPHVKRLSLHNTDGNLSAIKLIGTKL
jgi:hypothetical protein